MRTADQIHKCYEEEFIKLPYRMCHYKQFDYNLLKYIWNIRAPGMGEKISTNDVIIMADTETSKKKPDVYRPKDKPKYKTFENHVVAWTISIRAYHHNLVTLYGRKPSKLVETLLRIHDHMGGERTVVYFHNLSYDHIFLRKFAYQLYGIPKQQINTKSHYPIWIEYANGLLIKDSLILAQRKLERWAADLGVEHQKATGKWNYDKLRNQDTPLDTDELEYIEHDTLAGVECLDATMQALQKNISSIPLTATGIPREQVRKRGKRKAHEDFLKLVPTFNQYKKLTHIFHGGYTHGNRHFINTVIDWLLTKCRDFCSSYPYTLIAFKYPMERFTDMPNCKAKFILDNMDEFAFMFKFIATNITLKDDSQPMPALQFSKCIKTVNAILDNGRLLAANYVEIYLNEYDLAVIMDQYQIKGGHICCEVEMAAKDYLPRWFTDYIFEAFTSKTMLKGGDKVLYSIAKALVNSLYGMCAQKSIRDNIIEDYVTGEYDVRAPDDGEAMYVEYTEKVNSVLPYTWGVWTTSIAFYNVHQLAKCCRIPLYMDTDSCYGLDWYLDKVEAYNDGCKKRLRANKYGPVIRDGKEYWLGIAEHDGDKDTYTEFIYQGAKRYCGRCLADGKLHSTVAGVPKEQGAECLKDDINQFRPGFVFRGEDTGKKTHVYFTHEIYIDEQGNETADSISLIPCDYELDGIDVIDWEKLFEEDVEIQVYDE